MRTALGFPADVAAKLYRWARGRDAAPVAPRPPPKTLSVQVSCYLCLRILAPCKVSPDARAMRQTGTSHLREYSIDMRGTPYTRCMVIPMPQMSLTPEALPMHPSQVGQPAVASDSTGERVDISPALHVTTLPAPCSLCS